MVKSARELCRTPAHRVLWVMIIALAFGVALALGSRINSMEIAAIVGLSLIIIVVLLCCLCDLRFEYEHAHDATWSNMGFRQCKFLCWDKFTWSIFVSWGIISMLGGFLLISGGLAMYVRYGTYIRDEFWGFLVEVALMSVMTAIPIVLISWNRGGAALELILEVGVITTKFGGLHILLELCGFYAHVFSEDDLPLQRLSITGAGIFEMNMTELSRLVEEQVAIRRTEGSGHEKTFLQLLVAVFVISFALIAIVMLKERFRKQDEHPPGRVLTEKEEKKAHAKRELGIRMNVMLVLSVIMGGMMMLVLLLGLRSDEETEENTTVQQITKTWATIGAAGIVAALASCVAAVSLVAIRTRYAGFLNTCPWTFLAELCIVVLLSITPLGYVSYNRGHTHVDIAIELGILTLKFGGLHLLLELSGFYAVAMGGRYRHDYVRKLRRVGEPEMRGSIVEMQKIHPTESAKIEGAAASEPSASPQV